jgi:7-cyano-7-deazaguanine synthase in queuosine biosynthesis
VVQVLFRCDGSTATPPSDGWERVEELRTTGVDRDLNLAVEGLTGKLIDTIDERAADLIRIAAFAYGADQAITRVQPSDVHRAKWRRHLGLCLPVSDPAFWSQPVVIERLTEALGFVTEDTWSVAFSRAPQGSEQLRLGIQDKPVLGAPDAVMLVSGGTDSLCALIEAVADQGRRPIVVSHRSSPVMDSGQKALVGELRERFPGWSFPAMRFWIHRQGAEAKDTSQRTRGFLFAALGMAVAGQVGIEHVLLPDNGYVSINPPISDQLVGALASRGTHPTFLRLMNQLAELIFPHRVSVSNPLASRTRAEALGVLTKHGVPHLLDLTRTCGKYRGRSKDVPHCGGCSQCVDRRVAVAAAGLEAYDPAERYGIDIFADPLPEGEARTIVLSYVAFARQVEQLSAEELFVEWDELFASLDPSNPAPQASAEALAALLHRHSQETLAVVAEAYGRARAALARGTLPPTSLLMLLGPLTGTPEPTDEAVTHLEKPQTTPTAPAPLPLVHEFRHEMGVWYVVFQGWKATYPHWRGMTQLSLLLEAPGQPLDILALDRLEAVPADRRPAVEEGFSIGLDGTLDEVIDEVGIDQFKAGKQQLLKELSSARARGDTEEAQQIEQAIKLAQQRIRTARRPDGTLRRFSGAPKRAQQNVSKNIRFCLERIEVQQQHLHLHLQRFLHLSNPPLYDPHPPERWDVRR